MNLIFDNLNAFAQIFKIVHDDISNWNQEAEVSNNISSVTQRVVEILNNVSGMNQAHSRDFHRATPLFTLRDGSVVKTWKNPSKVLHIFIADCNGKMIFGGFVFWWQEDNLEQAIQEIKQKFA